MGMPELIRWPIAALLLMSLPALAQSELKIGFVNYSKILEEAPQAQAASGRLEEEFEPRSAKLRQMQSEVRKLEDALAVPTTDIDDARREEMKQMEADLLNRQRELKRTQTVFQEDLNIRRNEELNKLESLVEQVIAQMADEEAFDLILTERAIIAASERVDTTARVLERLNQLK
jgi:outer membrane protein